MEALLDERGPFVLIAREKVSDWHGVFNEDDTETDYDRAWEVEENVGLIEVRGNNVLVFGGFPHTIGKFDAINGGALVFRIDYIDDLNRIVAQTFTALPGSVWLDTVVKVELDGDYLLYAATCNASTIEQSLALNFSKGVYSVQEYVFTPDEEIKLILHRFLPA